MRRLDSRAVVIALASLTMVSSIVIAFAIDYIVPLTDTITILEEPGLRSTARDNLPLAEEAYQNNQLLRDTMPLLDSAAPASQAHDIVGLSDSAVAESATFYQVSASDVIPISDGPSFGSSAYDVVTLSEKASLTSVVIDMINLVEDAFIVFFLNDALSLTAGIVSIEAPADGEDEEDDRDDSSSGRVVIVDESYFVENPLARIQIGGLDFTDSQSGNNIAQVRVGQLVNIETTMRNYQNIDQEFTVFIQITDEQGYAIEILESSGIAKNGNSVRISQQWQVPEVSIYEIKIMVWTLPDAAPIPLAASVSETIDVHS